MVGEPGQLLFYNRWGFVGFVFLYLRTETRKGKGKKTDKEQTNQEWLCPFPTQVSLAGVTVSH